MPFCYVFKLSIPFWSDFNFESAVSSPTSVLVFQSHFGLISTENNIIAQLPDEKAFNPFLVWFQLNPDEISKYMKVFFQSLFGLISTYSVLKVAILKIHLSIPFWSDFNLLLSSPHIKHLLSFQSLFGLISTITSSITNPASSRAFNPFLVWFQHRIRP